MIIEELLSRIVDLENQVSDLKNQREPNTLQYKLNYAQSAIESLSSKVAELEAFVDKFNEDDKFAEVFTKEEVKELYKKSGLAITDIQAFLSKVYNNPVGLDLASGFINGKIDDIRVMSRLGKYLRLKAIKANVK